MNNEKGIYSNYERESFRMAGQALQEMGKRYGKRHKNNDEVKEVFLSIFQLGIAVERFSLLNGHLQIWASFTPDMFAADSPEETEQLG